MPTESEIREMLSERAKRLFGEDRAEVLRSEIEAMSPEIVQILDFELSVDDGL
jgi:hypothetical protein